MNYFSIITETSIYFDNFTLKYKKGCVPANINWAYCIYVPKLIVIHLTYGKHSEGISAMLMIGDMQQGFKFTHILCDLAQQPSDYFNNHLSK